MKKYNKNVVAHYEKHIDNESFKVIVLDDNDYYNIHIISECYKDEELNTIKQQELKEDISKDYFTKARMISYLAEHLIWDRFYSELGSASISVNIEEA